MPTYRVTDPNSGRTMRLTGDSPPTQGELEQLFAQFQVEAEPEIDPNIMANAPAGKRRAALQILAAEQSPLEAGMIAVGKGMTDVGRGLGLIEPATGIEKQAFEALEQESPISTTVGEVVGQAAPFAALGTPIGALATIPLRALATGALTAAEGATLASAQEAGLGDILKAGGIAGTLGATAEVVLPRIMRVGGQLVRRVLGREPAEQVLDAAGNPSPELVEAMQRSGLSMDDLTSEAQRMVSAEGVSDPAGVARREFMRGQGLEPTRAQVTRDVTDFQTQQELMKKSGPVREALDVQEQQIAGKFENAISATGGTANQAVHPVIDYVADRSVSLDQAISQAYTKAREVAPDVKAIKADNLSQALRKSAPMNQQANGLVSSVKGILEQRGVIDKSFKPTGRIDATTAEQIRIDINGLYDSTSPLGRSIIRELKDALDDDVAQGVGIDIFNEARTAKAKFERDLSRSKVNKFDRRKKNIVREILENKVDPDRFTEQTVLSRATRGDDLLQLKKYLTMDGSEAGEKAWNDMRAESMKWIRDQSIKGADDEPVITYNRLKTAMDRIGEGKLRALFSKQELKFLDDMLKVTNIRQPRGGTQQGLGPSAQAILRLESAVQRLPLGLSDLFGGLAVNRLGQVVVRAPKLIEPAKPSDLARAIPLAVPAALTAQEQ